MIADQWLFCLSTYQTKFKARKPTHDKVLASAEATVKLGGTLTDEQKGEAKQVFLADLGDLAEYRSAEDRWIVSRGIIAGIRKGFQSDFNIWQRKLGGQLDFTWEGLTAEVRDDSSSAPVASSNVTEEENDKDGRDTSIQKPFFSLSSFFPARQKGL